mmetsp:Transcript_2954/g.3457  ORF Transcript_2954/g.3457 Transcript_2954/m.3457 type:complete len:167 (-) Transcript_2954:92-592(-)
MSLQNQAKSKRSCHWLPCSIDYDGLAPVHVYFKPEPLHTVEESTSSDTNTRTNTTQAVSFRGRGLLAKKNHVLPKHIYGCVMMPNPNNDASTIDIKERFDSVLEWEHEYDERCLVHVSPTERVREEESGVGGVHAGKGHDIHCESGVQKSLAIFETLHAVHDPIPI